MGSLSNIGERLKEENSQAIKELFTSMFSPLCAYGSRYITDPNDVKDMVQEVFVALWEKRNTFEQLAEIKSYLYASVRNNCLNYLKHLSVRSKQEDALIYQLESDHSLDNPVLEEESFNQLYQEIHILPTAAKKIMLLALRGLKNKEIAEELGVSENTVKTQKKIVYSKLKKRLSPTMNTFLFSFC